nr:polysaccharide pyruvyl transferase family protein [uncultured Carboxylicivirga sp.]
MKNSREIDDNTVLIVNAVPLNNGDAALVFALYKKLTELNFNVKIATFQYDKVKKLYPAYQFVPDILDHKILKTRYTQSGIFKVMVLPILFVLSSSFIRSAYIIGAPGGYINSYYGFFGKIYLYMLAKLFQKKTIIYSQSIGPFNKKDKKIFKFFSRFIDFILVRDEKSLRYCENLLSNAQFKRCIIKSKDAAFLLNPLPIRKRSNKRIAISVREWKYDNRSSEDYSKLIRSIVMFFIGNGYAVDFLSTCQGINGYVDDSITANNIVAPLLKDYNDQINIIQDYNNLNEFVYKIKDYDFVIGTRLHMCILAMQNGIPAFNISYEFKGKECYSYLDLSDFSIDYNSNSEFAIDQLKKFISFYNVEKNMKFTSEKIAQVNHFMQEQLKLVMSSEN